MILNNITLKIKMRMKYWLSKVDTDSSLLPKSDKPRVIVGLAADYGNLGDVAITYAQTNYLKEVFPNHEVVDFPISKTVSHMKTLKTEVRSDDIITLVGGGNTGDLYDDIEYCRQLFIRTFKNNKVISFPQTIKYSDSFVGQVKKSVSKLVYSSNKSLVLLAREERSYKRFKKYYKSNEVHLVPDIVLSHSEKIAHERTGVVLCLRDDKEKLLPLSNRKIIIEKCEQYGSVEYVDTHIAKDNMNIDERKEELSRIWSKFGSKKLVITDRLHGMIFAVITGTPCIAFDNTTKKVSGVAKKWLNHVEKLVVLDYEQIGLFSETFDDMVNRSDNSKYEAKRSDFAVLDSVCKSI